jgi:hypothetical protein
VFDYDEMRRFQKIEEGLMDADEPEPLVFTSSDLEEWYGPQGPDEWDIEVLNVAMERNMLSREEYWCNRALQAEAHAARLEERLAELEDQ